MLKSRFCAIRFVAMAIVEMKDNRESPYPLPSEESMSEEGRAVRRSSDTATAAPAKGLSGSQTIIRGLDVLEAVAAGATSLADLSETLDLNRSTMHRLAATLVAKRYLSFTPRVGYALGPK